MRGIDKALSKAYEQGDLPRFRRLVAEYEAKSGKELMERYGDRPNNMFLPKVEGLSQKDIDFSDNISARMYVKSLRDADLSGKTGDRDFIRKPYFSTTDTPPKKVKKKTETALVLRKPTPLAVKYDLTPKNEQTSKNERTNSNNFQKNHRGKALGAAAAGLGIAGIGAGSYLLAKKIKKMRDKKKKEMK